MDLNQLLSLIMNLSTLVFVVTSMLAMGLSLTVAQILVPLRNARLVIAAANFAGDPDVIVMVLVLGLVDLSSLLITASLLGRRKNAQQH